MTDKIKVNPTDKHDVAIIVICCMTLLGITAIIGQSFGNQTLKYFGTIFAGFVCLFMFIYLIVLYKGDKN